MKHCFLPAVAVVTVLAALLVAGTASAAPLEQYTGDLCTGGTASASGQYASYLISYAVDDDASTRWVSDYNTNVWWQYQFAEPVTIVRYTLQAAGYNYLPTQVTIKASASGAFAGEEVTLDTQSGLTWSTSEKKTIDFSNTGSYQYYRLEMVTGQYGVTFSEIEMMEALAPTPTPVATSEAGDIHVYVDYPTPIPQYFDPTANNGDGPEPWLVRFYVGVFATFAFTYVLFRLVDTHQFYLLFMALCMAAAWVTKSVNGAAVVYLFMLVMVLVLKVWGGLQSLLRFGK